MMMGFSIWRRGVKWWWWWRWRGVACWHDDVRSSLDGRSSLHDSDNLSGYCFPSLIMQSGQFYSNVYKWILDGVRWLLNKLDGTFFIGGRQRKNVNGFDAPIKSFRYLELDMNLSCGCLLFCYLFRLFHLSTICSHLSTLCHFNRGEVYSWVESGFLLVVVSSFFSFTLFFVSIVIVSLFISRRGRSVCFRTV